jgi:peptidoglycan/LPS O-acetylase OafA/YrhL
MSPAGRRPAHLTLDPVTTQTADSPRPGRPATARALPYAPALDGVRAIAVAAVLLYHGTIPWMPGGFLGVDLFFVLSGYLITSLLLAERRATGGFELREFWLRRARRLLPAALTVIGVTVLIAALFIPHDLGQTRGDAIASVFYVNNWHQILEDQSYFAAFERPSLLRHLWSLSIEEQFYVFWPLLLGLALVRIGRRRTAYATLAAALLAALLMAVLFTPGQDPSRVYYGTDTHAAGLLIGALVAFLWPLGRFESPRRTSAILVLDVAALAALAAIVLSMITWHDYDSIVYRGGILMFSAIAAVLISAVVHPAGRVAFVLGSQPLRWIGQRSYGIYLWHWPVMALTRPDIDLTWPLWLLFSLQVALTLALAAASYRWIERPIRQRTAQQALSGFLDRQAPLRRLAIAAATAFVIIVPIAWVAAADPGPGTEPPALRQQASAAARSAPAAAAAPGAAVPGASTVGAKRTNIGKSLAVGASVMLAAQPELQKHAIVDAAVGRQPADIIARLQSYRQAGQLPPNVVVQIGENGPVLGDQWQQLREALRGVERVVLVTVRITRSWGEGTNDGIHQVVRDWPQARVADWYDASSRPGLLFDDATHPNSAGQKVYARTVKRALKEP